MTTVNDGAWSKGQGTLTRVRKQRPSGTLATASTSLWAGRARPEVQREHFPSVGQGGAGWAGVSSRAVVSQRYLFFLNNFFTE